MKEIINKLHKKHDEIRATLIELITNSIPEDGLALADNIDHEDLDEMVCNKGIWVTGEAVAPLRIYQYGYVLVTLDGNDEDFNIKFMDTYDLFNLLEWIQSDFLV